MNVMLIGRRERSTSLIASLESRGLDMQTSMRPLASTEAYPVCVGRPGISIRTFGSRFDGGLLYWAGAVVAVGAGKTHCDYTDLEGLWWNVLQRYHRALFDIPLGEGSQADRASVVAQLEQFQPLLPGRRTTHRLLPRTRPDHCEALRLCSPKVPLYALLHGHGPPSPTTAGATLPWRAFGATYRRRPPNPL